MAIVNFGAAGGGASSYKYSKEWHVDPVNGIDTNDGSYLKPIKTLAHLISIVGNSGEIVYLHAGTYNENISWSALNATIMGVGIGGVVNINGSVVFNSASSSTRVIGTRIKTIVHAGAGSLYLDSCQVTTVLQKTGSGYLEVNDSDTQTAAHSFSATADGFSTFNNSRVGITQHDAINHVATFKDCPLVAKQIHQQGTLAMLNCQGFAVVLGDPAVVSDGVFIARNSSFYDIDGSPGRISINSFHSLSDVMYNENTSSINISTTGQSSIFDTIGVRRKLKTAALDLHYDGTQSYDQYSIVEIGNTLYIANDNITSEPFEEGTTGATWRKIGAAIDPTVALNVYEFTSGGAIAKHEPVRLQDDGTVLGKTKPAQAQAISTQTPDTQTDRVLISAGMKPEASAGGVASLYSVYSGLNDLGNPNVFVLKDIDTDFHLFDGTIQMDDLTNNLGDMELVKYVEITGGYERYIYRDTDGSGNVTYRLYQVSPAFKTTTFDVYLNDLVKFEYAISYGDGNYSAMVAQNAAGALIVHPVAESLGSIGVGTKFTAIASGADLLAIAMDGYNTQANSYVFICYNQGGVTKLSRVKLSDNTVDSTIVLGNYSSAKLFIDFNNIGEVGFKTYCLVAYLYDNQKIDYIAYKINSLFQTQEYCSGLLVACVGDQFDVDVGFGVAIATYDGAQVKYAFADRLPTRDNWTSLSASKLEVVANTTTLTGLVRAATYDWNDFKKGFVLYTDDTGLNVQSLNTLPGETTTTGKLIGIAQEDAVSDAKVAVAIDGRVSQGHTGLTIGANYYVDASNDLVTTSGTLIGSALSDTEILVNFAAGGAANIIYQTSSSTIPPGAAGDILFVTPDGTSATSINEQWIHDGTDWVQVSGGVSVTSNIIDNSIVDPTLITDVGRYIVPAVDTVGDFIARENQYADYDGTTFTYSDPQDADIVLIVGGTNVGQYLKYSVDTTSWTTFTKTTGLPTYTWTATSSYKTNDLCVYNNNIYQANGNIPADTPFIVGTTGATWKQISSFGVVAEYGESPLATDVILPISSPTPQTNDLIFFTLPSAGVWEVTYQLTATTNTDGAYVAGFITNNDTVEIAGSRAGCPMIDRTDNGAINYRGTTTNTVRITVTGSTVYRLRVYCSGNTATTLISGIQDANWGGTKVLYKKISGNMPATGQSATYGSYSLTPRTTLGTFNLAALSGNMPVSGGNLVLLKAGQTYELFAEISAVNATYYDFAWKTSGGVSIGNTGKAPSPASTNTDGCVAAYATYTPSVDTYIKLDLTAVLNATNLGSHYVSIKQVGTTYVSQFLGALTNEYSSTNSYPAGCIVVKNNVLYQANGSIGAGQAFVEGLTGATWRAMYGRTDLLAEQFENNNIVDGSTITSAGSPSPWSDVNGSSFTILTPGTWELDYQLSFASPGQWVQTRITDINNAPLNNTLVTVSASEMVLTNRAVITVTGPTTYKLQARTFNSGTITIKNTRNQTDAYLYGHSFIRWKKVAGFTPTTGMVTQTGSYKVDNRGTVGDYALTALAGNMPVEATYFVTLTAGNTYELRASLSSRSGQTEFAWFTEAGTQIGSTGSSCSSNSTWNYTDVPAYVIYTPSSTVRVKLSIKSISTWTATDTTFGEVSIKQLGTSAASQFIGMLSNEWNIANAYPSGTIVVYGGALFQANSSIPANTAFVQGTSGATWKPMSSSSGMMSEMGNAVLNVVDNQVIGVTSSATAITALTYNIPGAGTWELDYEISVGVSLGAGNYFVTEVWDNLGRISSESRQINGWTSASGWRGFGKASELVTTTGAKTLYVKVWASSATSVFFQHSATYGYCRGYYKKISGFTPTTGTMSNYVYATLASDVAFGTNVKLPFVTQAGNIPNTNGTFTLTGGNTYRLVGRPAPGNSSNSGFIKYQWRNTTNNTFIGNEAVLYGMNNTTNGYNLSSTAELVLTPSTDMTVEFWNTSFQLGTGSTLASTSSITIEQLGTNNVSQFLGAMSNEWNLANAYPSGTLVMYNGALFQANMAIPTNTAFVQGTSGATWRPLYSNSTLLAEFNTVNLPANTVITGASSEALAYNLLTFTLPSAGTWEVSYIVNYELGSSNADDAITTFIVDSNLDKIPGSNAVTIITAGSNGSFENIQSIFITTTGARTYTLKAWALYPATTTIYGTSGGGSYSGSTKVAYKKISGFIPATNQSVQAGGYRVNNLGVAGDFTLTAVSGNMPVESSSYVSLTAGNTYELRAHLSIRSLFAEYAWFTEAGVQIGTNGWSGSNNANDAGSSAPAYIQYTPVANERVKLRLTSVNTWTITNTVMGEVSIKQMGTTATNQFLGTLSNDWNINNSYPSGSIVTKDGLLYKANAYIGAGTPWAVNIGGPTWALLNVQLAEYGEKALTSTVTIPASNVTSQTVDVLTFTLPSAGTWEVTFNLRGSVNTDAAYMVGLMTNNSNVEVPNSAAFCLYVDRGDNGAINYQATTSNTVRITTTGSEVYKLRARTTGDTTPSSVFAAAGDGGTKVIWKKISGFIALQPKTFTEKLTIGATTTAPTKATTTQLDYITLKDDGDGWCTVTFAYASENTSGAAVGSGTYLFTLPAGYKFDTGTHILNTQLAALSGQNQLKCIIPGSNGMISHDQATQALMVVPHTQTQFKILSMLQYTNGALWVFQKSDHYQLNYANIQMAGSFRFKKQ